MGTMQLHLATHHKRQVLDITDDIAQQLPPGGSGALAIWVGHTTSAITAADLDPGTDADLLDFFGSLVPARQWRHPHDPAHAPDHLLAAMIGPSLIVPFHEGQLQLGTWQRLILVEFDGPRERTIIVQQIKEG